MDVIVIVKTWGNYKKDDVIKGMPKSTAVACIKSGVVAENKPKTKAKAKK